MPTYTTFYWQYDNVFGVDCHIQHIYNSFICHTTGCLKHTELKAQQKDEFTAHLRACLQHNDSLRLLEKIHKGCNIGTKSRINSKCYIHTCRSVGNIVYVIFFQIHINFAFNFTSRNCLWLQMQVWALYETLSDWLNNGSLTDPPCCTSITSLNMDVVYSLEKQFVRGAANGLKM